MFNLPFSPHWDVCLRTVQGCIPGMWPSWRWRITLWMLRAFSLGVWGHPCCSCRKSCPDRWFPFCLHYSSEPFATKVKPCGQEGHINVSIERSKLVSGGWGVEVPALPPPPSFICSLQACAQMPPSHRALPPCFLLYSSWTVFTFSLKDKGKLASLQFVIASRFWYMNTRLHSTLLKLVTCSSAAVTAA